MCNSSERKIYLFHHFFGFFFTLCAFFRREYFRYFHSNNNKRLCHDSLIHATKQKLERSTIFVFMYNIVYCVIWTLLITKQITHRKYSKFSVVVVTFTHWVSGQYFHFVSRLHKAWFYSPNRNFILFDTHTHTQNKHMSVHFLMVFSLKYRWLGFPPKYTKRKRAITFCTASNTERKKERKNWTNLTESKNVQCTRKRFIFFFFSKIDNNFYCYLPFAGTVAAISSLHLSLFISTIYPSSAKKCLNG